MNEKKLKNIELIYRELRKGHASGSISTEEFKLELRQLGYRDAEGINWRYNGNWYAYQNNRWIKGDPYRTPPPGKTLSPTPPVKRSKPPLAWFIAIPVILAGIGLFLLIKPASSPEETTIPGSKSLSDSPPAQREAPPPRRLKPGIFHFQKNSLDGISLLPSVEKETAPSDEEREGPPAEEKDSILDASAEHRLLALADAFYRRIRLYSPPTVQTSGAETTRRYQGNFLGFSINRFTLQEGDRVIRDTLILKTPEGKRIGIRDNRVTSFPFKNLEELIQALAGRGLEVQYLDGNEPSSIRARLQITKEPLFPMNPGFIIRPHGIHGITLGSTVQNIHDRLPEGFTVIERQIKNRYEGYKIYFFHKIYDPDKKPMLIVNSNQETVLKIQVESEKYRTSRGIATGNSLGRLRAFYPELFVTVVENRIPFAFLSGGDIRFYLQIDKIDLQAEILPMDTRIVSIWIEKTGSPFQSGPVN